MTKRPRLDEDPPNLDGSKPISLQRRRVWRACEECRRKKVKCDSREPVCSQCAATNAKCTWSQTRDRAALSRHYVQELEARLLYMEQLFKQHAPDVEVFPKEGSGLPPHMAKNVPTLNPFPSATRPDPWLAKDDDLDVLGQVKQEDENNLTDHFGQMAIDAEGHHHWIGGSSTMTLIETFRNETADDEDFRATPSSDQSDAQNMLYFPTGLGFGKLKALPSAKDVEYPERDLADKLVDAYFERVHFLLPVLDRPSFLKRYQRLMDNNGVGDTPGWVAVVFAVFACAARFLDDPRIKSTHHMDSRSTAMIFYERAMMLYIIDHTSTQFAHVQCFALLSTFLASLNRLPQAWLLVGQAIRTAQDLGLHRSPKPLQLSKVDKETRRKVWWCVYGLDRCLAVQLGRPLGMDDNDIDVDMPVKVDDVDLPLYYEGNLPEREEPSLMEGFVALTALYKIASKVLCHVYAIDKLKGNIPADKAAELHKVVDKLDLQLTKWCDELHPSLRQSPTTPQMVSMSAVLCSSYYAVLITLHRNFLPTRKNLMQYAGSASVPKAVCASRSCIFLATSMNPVIPPSHHLAIFVQSLFSSAIIILLVVMHATEKKAADIAMSEVDNCVNALQTLENTWPGASKCKELLIELAQQAKENLAKVGKPKTSRHSSRSSAQLSPTGSNHDWQEASKASENRSKVPQATNGGQQHQPQRLPPGNVYGLLNSPTHSTPSPPVNCMAPLTRARDDTVVGRPLTIQDKNNPTKKRSQPGSPDFGPEMQDRSFAPMLQNMYTASSYRLPSPPTLTYLSDPRFFASQSQDFSGGAHGMAGGGIASGTFYGAQSSVPPIWSNDAPQVSNFESQDLPPFGGMDFMQNFVPTGQMQMDRMWDGVPEVFNAEPRIFGFMDEYPEGQM